MKSNYKKITTVAALISIFFLQGMWLYNTYKLLEKDFRKEMSNLFIASLMEETMLRLEDPDPAKKERREGRRIEEVQPYHDHYTNNRAFQDFLYLDDDPVLLEQLDQIFKEKIKNSFGYLDYSLFITNSTGNQTVSSIDKKTNINNLFSYRETVQLRNIDPEYITLVIASPLQIIFEKMFVMLAGSLILAMIVMYGLVLQVKIIDRQSEIAKLRQDFTHAIIHDMKNPVTSILMGIGLLKSGKIDDKQQLKERYYTIINQEGEHILELANRVLEIAQFEGRQVILSKQPVNLSDLLGNLTEKHQLHATRKIHFRMKLNDVETIYADLHYISEAFDNMIDNAVKFSKKEEDVEIYITSFYNDNNTRIIFRDNGIGIFIKDQKKLFQKIERASLVIENQKTNGFGLGLNFVYQVIKAHDGTIEMNNRSDSYSEFIISLPNHENCQAIVAQE